MLNINKIMGCEEDIVRFMKKEFNQRVEIIKNAKLYYENPNTTDEDVERTIKHFLTIFDELIKIGKEIEQYTGESIDADILENGFKGV